MKRKKERGGDLKEEGILEILFTSRLKMRADTFLEYRRSLEKNCTDQVGKVLEGRLCVYVCGCVLLLCGFMVGGGVW